MPISEIFATGVRRAAGGLGPHRGNWNFHIAPRSPEAPAWPSGYPLSSDRRRPGSEQPVRGQAARRGLCEIARLLHPTFVSEDRPDPYHDEVLEIQASSAQPAGSIGWPDQAGRSYRTTIRDFDRPRPQTGYW